MDIEDKIDYCLDEKKLLTYDEGLEIVKEECGEIINVYKRAGRVLFRGTNASSRMKAVDDTDKIFKVIPRKRRAPKDTPKDIQTMLDKLFFQRFGWKPRSHGVFAAGFDTARYYGGQAYAFFPVDGYECIWSPKVDDLFNDFVENGYGKEYDIGSVPGMWVNADNPKQKVRTLYDLLDLDMVDTAAFYNREPTNVSIKIKGGGFKKAVFNFVPDLTKEQWEEEQGDAKIDIINSYTNTNLVDGIRNHSPAKEFTFKCDAYYLINPKMNGRYFNVKDLR